ncbi:MAG: glycosyltransferase [Candidatus Mycalebacterium zealandia]|nr:MAG: glycosyltransferase [Candidatus Mycalebacterium zealandia]
MKSHNFPLPLVSILVLSYNRKSWLRESLDSILAQDYPNIEIIVCDDASTDGSQDVLREYKEKNSDINFVLSLSSQNEGITANLNKGLSFYQGKYVVTFSDDDIMLPEKITRQVAFMEDNPDCAVCYHNMEVFDEDTNKTLRLFNHKGNSYEGGVEVSLKYGMFSGAPSCMYRADKIPDGGCNPLLSNTSDWFFIIEILAGGGTINYIDEVLLRYRRHANADSMKSDRMDPGVLDTLNTCNIVIFKYTHLFNEAMYAYARRLEKLSRKKGINYRSALISSLRLSFRMSAFLRLLAYIFSFGKLKF